LSGERCRFWYCKALYFFTATIGFELRVRFR
jgi:hypothetical protein